MQLILCLDERDGMAFYGRRQSQDGEVCRRILEIVGNDKLWISPYSSKLFDDTDRCVCINAAYLDMAETDDYCFAELENVSAYLKKIKKLIVFRWNRHYPSDLCFSEFDSFKLVTSEDFPGNSHELITMEVYALEKG